MLVLILLIGLLSGCANRSINDNDGQIPLSQEHPPFRDGSYHATFSYSNAEGYRPDMNLTILGGIITRVTYREIAPNGKDKLSDLEYVESFKTKHNLDLGVLYMRLYNSVIRNQGIRNLPDLGDFPEIRNADRTLCETILLAARDGNAAPMIVPMNDVYTVTGPPDEEGYVPTLKVTFVSDNIASAVYSMVHPTGATRESREDIKDAYLSASGVVMNQVFVEYASKILQQNTLDPVDAIAGATQTKNDINGLLDQIRQLRRPLTLNPELEKAE
jgi:major membrane immunogen (membrane-anchored lipoprotein)